MRLLDRVLGLAAGSDVEKTAGEPRGENGETGAAESDVDPKSVATGREHVSDNDRAFVDEVFDDLVSDLPESTPVESVKTAIQEYTV